MKKQRLKVKKHKYSFKKILSPFTNKNNQRIFGSLILLISTYLFISFISFFFSWQADDSIISGKKLSDVIFEENINNIIGGFGAYISNLFIKIWFGISAFFIPFIMANIGLKILKIKKGDIDYIILNSLILIITIPIIISHIFGELIIAGGLGIFIEELINSAIGDLGTSLLVITFILVYLIIYFDINIERIKNLLELFKTKYLSKKEIKEDIEKQEKEFSTEFNNSEQKPVESNPTIIKDEIIENIKESPSDKEETSEEIKKEGLGIEIKHSEKEEILSKDEITKKLEELGEYDPTLELSKYKMPTIELLNNYGDGKIAVDKKDLEEKKDKIVETLGHYKIGIVSISATIGPTITLYEIVPDAGVRISKIKNLEDDIALSLAAEGIRIIAPMPGKGTIGIEVPNKTKNTVSMLEVLKSEKFQNNDMSLPIALGKTISNETFVIDLTKMPHILMAGATGQGKSVGLNVILTSLLYKKHPSQIKFVLVDPKKVELTLFNKIEKHYLAKLPDNEDAIITDTKKVVNTINSLCIEMDERYELCKTAQCRNISEYNNKFVSRKLNPNKGHRYLPYIVLVIDEFADLIMTAGKEIETPIARLAQLARAIGIHLIVATQRPSVNVITGVIKANFPARIAFRVTSTTDSRTILDSKGAEQLIGMGDMLISTGSELKRLQCAFIDTPEVKSICDFIGEQKGYSQAHILPEYEIAEKDTSNRADLDEKDPLFNDAALIVVKHQSGSTSLIQRKLKLGYNRAGRIIDQLEAANIVGPFEGSKARQVLVKDEFTLNEIINSLK